MTAVKSALAAGMILLWLGQPTLAEPYIYPAKGQSEQMVQQDKRECGDWARQQSGFDPMHPPAIHAAPTSANPGRGALGGAALGGLIGSTSANAGKGALIGAAGGALIGGVRRNHQQSQQVEAQQRQIDQLRAHYDRANAACLEGRGYTLK